jgi:hypothetical protein
MQISKIFLPVVFNNLAPIKETLVSHRVAFHCSYLEPMGTLHIWSCARLMSAVGSGWALISSEQTNSFLLEQKKSMILQIGANQSLAGKKTP